MSRNYRLGDDVMFRVSTAWSTVTGTMFGKVIEYDDDSVKVLARPAVATTASYDQWRESEMWIPRAAIVDPK